MGRRASGSGLASVPAALLQAELRRRNRAVSQLVKRREKLVAKLAAVDEQIRQAGGALGAGGGIRVRPKNDMSLADALAKVLKGKTMGVTEVAEAVLKEGYRSNAANFRTIVNQTLIKNKSMFKKVGRGQYTAA